MNRWMRIGLIFTGIATAPAVAQESGGLLQASDDVRQAMEEMEKRLQERIDELEEELYRAEPRDDPQRARLLNAFNPQLTVFGNFVGRLDDKKVFTHEGDRIDNRFHLRVVEVDLRAAVDPWADAMVLPSFHSEVPNEYEVGIEEGFVTLKRLPILDASPWGLKITAGRFRADFGRLNKIHTHDLPWVTPPRAYMSYLGPDGYANVGMSADFFLPTPGESNSLQATLQVLDGGGIHVAEEYEGADPSGVARLAWFLDLADGHDLEVGGSAFYGKHDVEVEIAPGPPPIVRTFGHLVSQLYGVDVAYRWKPYAMGAWRSFIVGGEAYYGDLDQPGGRDLYPFGFFVWTQYQFDRNLYAGVRYDWFENHEDTTEETGTYGVFVSYYTTEFLRLRVGYEHTQSDIRDLDDLDSSYFEINFVFGSHPVHPYWVNR